MIQELKVFKAICMGCMWEVFNYELSIESAIEHMRRGGWLYHKSNFYCPDCRGVIDNLPGE